MFALTAVVMLMASPIAWPHYFMWLLPATLYLNQRPRLLVAVALLGQLGMMIPVLRGLGVHTVIALVLFAMVARDFLVKPIPLERGRRVRPKTSHRAMTMPKVAEKRILNGLRLTSPFAYASLADTLGGARVSP